MAEPETEPVTSIVFLLIVGFDFKKYPVGKPHDAINSRESRTNFETTEAKLKNY